MADARHPAPGRGRGPALADRPARPARLPGTPARRAQLGHHRRVDRAGPRIAVEALSGGRGCAEGPAGRPGRRRRRGHRPARLPPALVPLADRDPLPRADGRRRAVLRAPGRVDPRAPSAGRRTRRWPSWPAGSSAGTGRRRSRTSRAGRASGSPRPAPAWRPSATGWSASRSTASSTSWTPRRPTCSPPAGRRRAALPAAGLRRVRPRLRRPHRLPRPGVRRPHRPRNNGMFRPTVVHDGRVVGTWRWTGRGAKRTVTATPFTDFPRSRRAVPASPAGLSVAAQSQGGGRSDSAALRRSSCPTSSRKTATSSAARVSVPRWSGSSHPAGGPNSSTSGGAAANQMPGDVGPVHAAVRGEVERVRDADLRGRGHGPARRRLPAAAASPPTACERRLSGAARRERRRPAPLPRSGGRGRRRRSRSPVDYRPRCPRRQRAPRRRPGAARASPAPRHAGIDPSLLAVRARRDVDGVRVGVQRGPQPRLDVP